jgi:hypothetical protein
VLFVVFVLLVPWSFVSECAAGGVCFVMVIILYYLCDLRVFRAIFGPLARWAGVWPKSSLCTIEIFMDGGPACAPRIETASAQRHPLQCVQIVPVVHVTEDGVVVYVKMLWVIQERSSARHASTFGTLAHAKH